MGSNPTTTSDTYSGPIPHITLPAIYITPDEPAETMTQGLNETGNPGFSQSFSYATGGALDLSQYDAQIAPLDGPSTQRISDHAGLPPPDPAQFALDDNIPPPNPVALPQNLRQEYSDALQNGSTSSAQDFAERVAGLSWQAAGDENPSDPAFQDHDATSAAVSNAAQAVAAGLPDHQDLIDHSLALSAAVAGQPNLDMAKTIRSNLLDAWAATGASPDDMIRHAYAEPDLAGLLATPPPPPPSNFPNLEDLQAPGRDAIHQAYNPLLPGDFYLGAGQAAVGAVTGGLVQQERDYQAQLKAQEEQPLPKGTGPAERILNDPIVKAAGAMLGIGVLPKATSMIASPAGQALLRNVFRDESGQLKPPSVAEVEPTVGAILRSGFRNMTMSDSMRETWDRKIMETGLLKYDGDRRQSMALAREALQGWIPTIDKYIPEWQAWAQQFKANVPLYDAWIKQGGDPKAFAPYDPTEIQKGYPLLQVLDDHIQRRPGGATLPDDHPLLPLANTIRDLMDERQQWLNEDPERQRAMIENYLPQSWNNPAKQVNGVYGVSKVGSAEHLQERTIPYTFDGVVRGLDKKFPNVVEGSLHYISQVDSLIAAERQVKYALENGAYWDTHALNPTDRMFNGPRATRQRGPITEHVFAPRGIAIPYNIWVDRGIQGWQNGGPIYDNLMKVKNATLGLAFGLSGFHPMVILKQAFASKVGVGAEAAAQGDITGAATRLSTGPAGIATLIDKGMRGRDIELQRAKDIDPLEKQINDLWLQSGGRAAYEGRGAPYWSSKAGSLYTQWRNYGSDFLAAKRTAQDLLQPWKEIAGKPEDVNVAHSALYAAPRTLGATIETLGRISDTITGPTFDKLVPLASRGAFYDAMENYLKNNPTSDEWHTLQEAIRVQKRIQNGMGEMNMDMLFWPKALTQIGQLLTTSIGWELGTARAISSSLSDIALGSGGKRFTTNVGNLTGYLVAMGVMSAAYQYFKTGTTPFQTSPWNFIAPQTRPNTPGSGVLLPGEEKEFIRLYRLGQKAGNDITRWAQVPFEYVTGKANPDIGIVKDFLQAPNTTKFLTNLKYHLNPSGVSTAITGENPRGENPAVNLSPVERLLGLHGDTTENTSAARGNSRGGGYHLKTHKSSGYGGGR